MVIASVDDWRRQRRVDRDGMWPSRSLSSLYSSSPIVVVPCNLRNSPLVLTVIISILWATSSGVPCFCTESRCTYGYCESAWCLVGIKHNGRVIRTCGSQSSTQLQPCRQDVGDWQDVCSCTTPYCNTFAYLRYEIRWGGGGAAANLGVSSSQQSTSDLVQGSSLNLGWKSRGAQQQITSSSDALPPDGESGVSPEETIGLSGAGGGTGGGGRRANGGRKKVDNNGDVVFERNDEKEPGLIRQSHLVVVLIVVPLAVAGVVACFVFNRDPGW